MTDTHTAAALLALVGLIAWRPTKGGENPAHTRSTTDMKKAPRAATREAQEGNRTNATVTR